MVRPFELIYAEATDAGRSRRENQDSLYAGQLPTPTEHPPIHLFLVADGMGGYQGGDVASRIAVMSFREGLQAAYPTWPACDNSTAWLELLSGLVQLCNTKILEAQAESEFKGMGTTMTAAVECMGLVHLVHVGDSRLYHFDGETMYQITRDHSMVGELLRSGQLTPEEARNHPRRNIITQALGVAWDLEIEAKSLELTPESKLLICSDGLSGMLNDEEIAAVLAVDGEPYDQVRQLIDSANERGGKDNISVIIAAYRGALGGERA